MKDVVKHIVVKLVTNPINHMKLVAKPEFYKSVIFDKKLVAVHMKRPR